MIKLKTLLREINYNEETNSWQKPDGTFLPVIDTTHDRDAFKYVGGDPKNDHRHILWKGGWQRIVQISNAIYANNMFRSPNDIQKRKLIELAIKLGLIDVVWDRGHGSNLLWSKNDMLEEIISSQYMNAKTEHFSIKWGEPDIVKSAGKILLNGNVWFANALKMPDDYGKYGGKWMINRHTGAFDLGLEPIDSVFNAVQELLDYLENWYKIRK